MLPLICCSSVKHSDKEQAEVKAKRVSKSIERQIREAQKNEANCVKLLLLGTGESGKSTILKQMKIIHVDGFSEEEKKEYVSYVRKNLRDAMLAVLGGMRMLGIEFELKENLDIAKTMIETPVTDSYLGTQKFFDDVERLWHDHGVRMTFSRANEYQLIDSAKYFLDRISDIRQETYIPSEQDILRCRTMTNGVSELQFEYNSGEKNAIKLRVFDVSGQRGARKKWIQLFDSVTAILFLVDTSSFDQTLREDRTQNRLMDSLEVFEQAWTNKYLRSVPVIVFLNKVDILDAKIRAGHRINQLQSFAANWLEMYEDRDCNLGSSVLESLDRFSLAPGSSIAMASSPTADTAPSPNHLSAPLTSTPLSNSFCKPMPNGRRPSVKEHSLIPDIRGSFRRASFRNLPNAFGKTVNAFNTNPHIRRFRRSFRQAIFSPTSHAPAYCGQNSRVSCTAAVAQVILGCPYHDFVPSVDEQKKFFAAVHYVEYSTIDPSGNGDANVVQLLPPHRETLRTACYIKHLFHKLTKEHPTSCQEEVKRRQCLFYYTCAVNTDCIRKVLEGCREFLIEDHLERFGLL
ncbi:unnamed protein product [Calicophoron daubneyi]|uniref:Guanine nucleotide-binding protein G(q) subunit alpha n=1 Tax=Calicophoron daubneyi TaxID=300641 RepID=A0AAV2T3D6_CALDB